MVRIGLDEHPVWTMEARVARSRSNLFDANLGGNTCMVGAVWSSLLGLEVETCAVLYLCALQPPTFATKMVCNFPGDEIFSFDNSIANIWCRFRPSLETYWGNLRNGKQYSLENLYLIDRRQLLPGPNLPIEIDRAFSSARGTPEVTSVSWHKRMNRKQTIQPLLEMWTNQYSGQRDELQQCNSAPSGRFSNRRAHQWCHTSWSHYL